jgi:2-polyprenyl-3-methyl-5-hydroxy-6-metoxy-1,4-benzoquinol methylase
MTDTEKTNHMEQAGKNGVPGLKYDFDRPELLSFMPESAHAVLDVGCGSGAFGHLLRARHPHMDLWAIEPDPASAARAAEGGFDHVIVGSFPDGRLPPKAFDVIVCADVLEHMADPEVAVRAALGLIRPDGIMVASLPNVRNWRAVVWPLLSRGAWRYTERGILDRTHLRFFTRRSACELFADSGWSVERVRAINMVRRERWISRLSGGFLDEFLAPQYVLVARPSPTASAA